MTEITLLVGLKIPDTTAITTFHALEELGFSEIKKLSRLVYYKFSIDGDEEPVKKFKEKAVKTDVLVNSNKNTSEIVEGDFAREDSVLIQSLENDCDGLLETLKKLGLNNINSMQQGILWTFETDNKETIKKATEELLYNKHYQKASYL